MCTVQLYEMSRLLGHDRLDQLMEFARQRERSRDTTTWLPIREQCEDGQLLILPGDSRYRIFRPLPFFPTGPINRRNHV